MTPRTLFLRFYEPGFNIGGCAKARKTIATIPCQKVSVINSWLMVVLPGKVRLTKLADLRWVNVPHPRFGRVTRARWVLSEKGRELVKGARERQVAWEVV